MKDGDAPLLSNGVTAGRTSAAPTMSVQRLRIAAAAVLLAGGLLVMLVGGGAVAASWYSATSWAATDEAEQASRALAAPQPRWVEAAEAIPTPRPTRTPRAVTATAAPAARPTVGAAERAPAVAEQDGAPVAAESDDAPPASEAVTLAEATPAALPTATPEPRAPADAIALVDTAFRFLDPPEPGAQAQITVNLRNDSSLPTGPVRLSLSTRWLVGWRVLAADPPVLDDQPASGNRRAFDFPGLDPEAEGSLELHLVATDDAVDPPDLRLSLVDGDEIGRAQPETVAPRPNPGPARSIEIPRLKVRVAVVPTTWEPPAFVVGQLKGTANLSEGNTVLIGHLNGLAGDVFARLSELEPGDEVIAVSRGLEYRFIVSETMVLTGDDSVPLQPTDEPRLTLLTCAGEWDPIGLDYSHRLWVVAEPAELAETTLNGERPGPLTRQLGLAPALTLLPPANLGPSPKELAAAPEPADALPVEPGVRLMTPDDGSLVGARVTVRGRLTDDADTAAPLWLAVRAEIEGSRWYLYESALAVDADGQWTASLELGGQAGIRHTIVVAPVDPATDTRLRRHVQQRPGEPLSLLPDAFEGGARVTVVRR